MKTFEIIRSKEIINLHQNNHQSRPNFNSLMVDKELALGSSNRGLGIRFEILVGGGFPFTSKRKSKGGLLPQQMATTS
jgi:hypothetical protein